MLSREEQFQLYENAVKAEQKELEEQFNKYKNAVKNENKISKRISVMLDNDLVEKMSQENKTINKIINEALKEWQSGNRVQRKKVSVQFTVGLDEEENLYSPNYNNMSDYLNDILASYYSRR